MIKTWLRRWPLLVALPACAEQAPDFAHLPALTVVAAPQSMAESGSSRLTGEELASGPGPGLNELAQRLPGLSAALIHPREASLAIRGLGHAPTNDGLASAAAVYVDQFYLARPGMAVPELFDVEQLQLLRGPQGSQFGRGSSAGALRISTRAPVFAVENRLEVSGGERELRQLRAVFNTPLAENQALRLGVYADHDAGWVRNHYDGRWLNGSERQGMRLQWLWQVDPDLRLRASFSHHHEQTTQGVLVPYAFGPLNRGLVAGNLPLGVAGSNATTIGQLVAALGGQPVTADPSRYAVWLNDPQGQQTTQQAATLEVVRRSAAGRLTALTAWRGWHFSPRNDIDSSSLSALAGGFSVSDGQFTQELRWEGELGAHSDYVLGAFWLAQHTESRNAYRSGPLAWVLASAPNNASLSGQGQQRSSSLGVFADITEHLTPRLDLGAGLRYSQEQQQARVVQQAVNPPFPVSPLFMDYRSGPLQATHEALTGRLRAVYHLTPAWQTQWQYSEGEKAGGYNLNGVVSPAAVLGADVLRIRPERNRQWEWSLLRQPQGDAWQLAASVFQGQVSAYQANTVAVLNGSYVPYLSNVGSARLRGAESELRWQAAGVSWRAALTYLDARFTAGSAATPAEEFNGPGGTSDSGYGVGSRSLAGKRVNGSSRWQTAWGAYREWQLAPGIKQFADLAYAWRSAAYTDVNNSRYSQLPAYGVLDLATGWRGGSTQAAWELSLWLRNALDKHYYLTLVSGQNAYAGAAAAPRTFGATLKWQF